MPQKEEPIVIIEDKSYSVLRDDAIGPKKSLHPLTWGRESDGTPSYPYITGWLQGTLKNAIRNLETVRLTHGGTFDSVGEVIDDLQQAFDQAELWTDPYDSPTTEEED